ncbi:MAG TPA: hypothetical protein ENK43_17585 [Planctomycetes bacterium]|nr:hypothetical protein [Planctomycetota bacterium]
MPQRDILDLLKDDHRVILSFLRALDAYADSLDCDSADPDGARVALEFVREFIEKGHHVREEEVLFRYLAEKGRGKNSDGRHLIHCHDEARDQLEGMRMATPPTTPDARTAFVWNARAYTALMREHMVLEESWLYPRVGELLSADDRRILAERLSRYGFPREASMEAAHRRIDALIQAAGRGFAEGAGQHPSPY